MNQSFLNPEEVLDQLGLRPNMVVADFGCGSGGFILPLAKKLEDGLVYALDVRVEPLSSLKSRAIMEEFSNIRFIRCDLEKQKGSTLPEISLDLVIIANTLFQAEDKESMVQEAKRVLKKGGILTIVDWLPGSTQGPDTGRIAPEQAKKIAQDCGFKISKNLETGKYHYGFLFKKS
ncbi:MAG: class I SAM-dependent methyltransferase [Patescibacteria group bacterium]|nr:class I SAM-dependent methyltransferase [Patescibacteria group bacterium]